jgi:hypothetical protein
MARKAFAFALGQRVNVPGKKGVQGVVSLPRLGIEIVEVPTIEPVTFWFVRWLAEDGAPLSGWFTEAAMAEANAPAAEIVGVDGGGKSDAIGTAAIVLERIGRQWRPSGKPILKRSDLRKPDRRRKARR